MQVVSEILDALVRKVPVEMSPSKLFLHVASRLERLHGLHYMKVGHIFVCQLRVLRHVDILFGDHHALLKKEFVDGNPILLRHQHRGGCRVRGYVKEQFAWRHFYWYLTNEGIQYLRDYLHLPPEIVPATLRRSRPETGRPRPKGPEGERPARFTRGEADRDTYRRSAVPPGADKKAEAGAGSATEFQFRGGFGRGRGQPPQ